MTATGSHEYFYSLRGAQPPGEGIPQKVGTPLRRLTVHPPPSHASVAHLTLHAGRLFFVPSALRQFLPINTPIWGYSLRLLLKAASPQGFSCGDAVLIPFWIQSFAWGYSLHRSR